MNRYYATVAERAGNRCEYCRAPEQVFNFPFENEHIWPRSNGGDNSSENLALACESCNVFKSDATTAQDPVESVEVPLFHPRHDHWDEHFTVNAEEATIDGQTPKGRATILRLRINSTFQIQARRQWISLGLYP
ncbi:MAG: HNH endonuclease signature motif containing protein [Armatimonadota bacterium]